MAEWSDAMNAYQSVNQITGEGLSASAGVIERSKQRPGNRHCVHALWQVESLEPRLMLSGWDYTDWGFRKPLTIDHTQVAETVTDFPALLQWTDADLADHAQADGDDILFALADTGVKLDHEIEAFDPATGSITAWVRLPQLSSTQDTLLNVYFGNGDAADQSNPHGVWGSDYAAVHHFEETTGPVTDSSAAGNDGIAYNGVVLNTDAIINGGVAFDGINDRIGLSQLFTGMSNFTVEGWIYTGNQHGYAISQRNYSQQGMLLQYYPPSGELQLYVDSTKLSQSAAVDTWHYVVASFDGTNASLSVDGSAVGAPASITWPNLDTWVGDRDSFTRPFLGVLDEFRVSTVARSAGWSAVSYANQSDPAAFSSVGALESNGAPIISAEMPPDGTMGVDTGLAEISFTLFDPDGDPMDYTVTTSPDVGSDSATGVGDGAYTLPLGALESGTTYTWEVTVTDGDNVTSATFEFSTGVDWAYPEWQYRRQIVIDHTKVPADLTNFPVLVDFADPDLAGETHQDGDDIFFAEGDTQVKLAHEIESYLGYHLRAWVNIPFVSSTQDTVFWMYYGHSDPDIENQENPEGVWDSSYLAVHHLEESNGVVTDSTSHDNDGDPINGVTQGVDGIVDSAYAFDGVNDRVQLPQVYTTESAFTFEGWVNPANHHGYFITQRDSTGRGAFIQYYAPGQNFQFFAGGAKVTVPASPNQWYYIVATFDGATARMYVNDAAPASAAGSPITWPNLSARMGYSNEYTIRGLEGILDEVRLSSVARSEAYVRASYASQSDPTTFAIVGAKEISGETIVLSDPYPANGAADVEFNPTLEVDISHFDLAPMTWTVDLMVAGEWVQLASGDAPSGEAHLTVPTSGVDQFETEYQWRVTVDSEAPAAMAQEIYSFTTRMAGNYAPKITEPAPDDGSVGVELNPTLSAEIRDLDGDPMDITFAVYDGGVWQTVAQYVGVGTGVYSADPAGLISTPASEYQWRVTAIDPAGSNQATEEVYTLRTGGILTPKFDVSFDMSGRIEAQLQPVMGDIDNDGVQEIVMVAGSNIHAINGQTGEVEWSVIGGARDTSAELVDLDNDGTPEVLYGMLGARVRAVNGDGTIRWTSQLIGEDQSLFPIVAYDVDGDGYPTIYFTTEDVTPDPYNGNPEDYTGALNMLDHEGNLLAHQWLYHPCWGGPAIADVNFDGVFEVFVSDRRGGYHGTPSNGLSAFNAHTLDRLWTRPDIHHSSPLPIIADVTGDGILNIVAQKIVSDGPIVLNALTGQTIYDWSNTDIPTHGVGTVYDIDDDGNLEIITATGYPANAPKDFVVFDLIDGTEDFHPTFDFHAAWSPKVGDVTGNGKMEILAAMGDQGSPENFPLLIYDNEYNLIDEVIISGAGQLTPARVFDTDGDGLSEVVVAGVNGLLTVFDTKAPAEQLGAWTWTQMYSPMRQGVPVPTDPIGPKAPVIRDPSLDDNATGVGLGPVLSVDVYDFQKDDVDVQFEIGTFDGATWNYTTVVTHTDGNNGMYAANTTGFVTEYNTQYAWRVTTTDEHGHSDQFLRTFTTATPGAWAQPDWGYRKQIVVNHDLVAADLTDFPLLVQVTDPQLAAHAQSDGDDILFTSPDGLTPYSYEIESYNAATGDLTAWVKIPLLSSTVDTAFQMYYGNPGVGPHQSPAEVWDAGYLAVHHLEELAGTIIDSTGYGNDGAALNGVTLGAAGPINGAAQFDGVNDRIALPQLYNTETAFSFEGWIYTGNKQGYAFSQRDFSSNGVLLQYYPPSGQLQAYVNGTRLVKSLSANAWHYVALTFDGSTARLYADLTAPTSGSASISWPNLDTLIGDRSSFDREFLGSMDELRFSSVARSQDFLQTSYFNQSNPQAFADLGDEETGGSGGGTKPVIFDPAPADGADLVDHTIAEFTFELFDAQGDPMDYTVDIPGVGSFGDTGVANGTVSIPLAGLAPFTEYTVTVMATDGSETNYRQWTFMTTDYTSVFRDGDFEESAGTDELRVNSPWQNWYESRNDFLGYQLVTLDEANVGGNATKKARFQADSGDNAYLTQLLDEPITGQYSVQWDIYIDEILDIDGDPDRAGWMLLGDNGYSYYGPNSAGSNRFAILAFEKDGGGTSGDMKLVARGPDDAWTSFTALAGGIAMDQWHTIKVNVDLDVDTYDVFLNGIFVARMDAHTPKDSLNAVSFAQWDDGAGTFYVDNVGEGEAGGEAPWVFNPAPVDFSEQVNVGITELTFEILDNQGDLMDVTVTTSPDIGDFNGTGLSDGAYAVPVSGLAADTTYEWVVTADDGVNVTQRTFTFSTWYDGDLLADGDFSASVDSADLITNSPGQDWYEGRDWVPDLLTLDETNVGGNATKKALLPATEDGDIYLTQDLYYAASAPVAIEWDIYVDEILNIDGNPDRAGWMIFGEDSNGDGMPNQYGERFGMMSFAKPGGGDTGTMDLVIRDWNDGWTSLDTIATGLNLKQWYNIRVEIDLPSLTYDVFVDDAFVATVQYRRAMGAITHVSFAQFYDGAGTFYVDNVSAQHI